MTEGSSSSSNVVNYSIRHNKAIERSLVFESLSRLQIAGLFQNPLYVGLGSVWFSDFDLAHRILGVADMYSIEADDIMHQRATFNRLYRTLRVLKGDSTERVPELLEDIALSKRSWIVWLDYDRELDEGRLDELRALVRRLPNDSVLLTTFSALHRRYAQKSGLRDRLTQLFDRTVVDAGVPNRVLASDEYFSQLLARETTASLVAEGLQAGRSGGCSRVVQLAYRDSVPMVTVGVALPSTEKASLVETLTSTDSWVGYEGSLIQAPPLTAKEVQALRSLLPSSTPLTVQAVQSLGFDLAAEQVSSFSRHYLRYPTYAQVL